MDKQIVLGFSRLNATLRVGGGEPRKASISPYNYQNTPKSVCKALTAGKGKTAIAVVVNGATRYGGICVGRDVGPANSAKPGKKINVFWVTPQDVQTHERNSYVGQDGQTVFHRTDWAPIDAAEAAALQSGKTTVYIDSVDIAAPTKIDANEAEKAAEDKAMEAKAAQPAKGKKAKREPATV